MQEGLRAKVRSHRFGEIAAFLVLGSTCCAGVPFIYTAGLQQRYGLLAILVIVFIASVLRSGQAYFAVLRERRKWNSDLQKLSSFRLMLCAAESDLLGGAVVSPEDWEKFVEIVYAGLIRLSAHFNQFDIEHLILELNDWLRQSQSQAQSGD